MCGIVGLRGVAFNLLGLLICLCFLDRFWVGMFWLSVWWIVAELFCFVYCCYGALSCELGSLGCAAGVVVFVRFLGGVVWFCFGGRFLVPLVFGVTLFFVVLSVSSLRLLVFLLGVVIYWSVWWVCSGCLVIAFRA